MVCFLAYVLSPCAKYVAPLTSAQYLALILLVEPSGSGSGNHEFGIERQAPTALRAQSPKAQHVRRLMTLRT